MSNGHTTVIDFVAKGDSPDEWKLVLVEEGPWHDPISAQLRRVQERLYECIDATLDGQLAERFPESNGKKIIIRLDCYNLPKQEVTEFFNNFSKGVFSAGDYQEAIKQNDFVRDISFEVSFDSIH
jgi:hypothetical protein